MKLTRDQIPMNELPAFFEELVKPSLADDSETTTGLSPVSRRQFFKISGVAGGGLVLGGIAISTSKAAKAQGSEETVQTLSPYVQIQPNGRINLFSKNPECGQGIKTGLPLIIAEELDCAWEDVDVVQAEINGQVYGAQFAGGSLSTPMNWMPMRQAGATARAMILAAAAQQLDVPQEELSTSNTKVIHNGTEYPYGDFAELAATMPIPAPDTLTLKEQSQFSLLGKRYSGVDNMDIVQGKPLFGADVRLPNMVYATYTRCPNIGGKPVSFNEDHIKSLPGVIDAFMLDQFRDPIVFATSGGAMFAGVAIVAESTWAAIKAKRELQVEWDTTEAVKASWSDIVAQAYGHNADGGSEVASKGDVESAIGESSNVVEAFYEYPYLSHAQLEPQTATALYQDGKLELWAPSQMPGGGETGGADVIGLEAENSVLHQTRIGGGFGRKLANDYVYEAAAIARRMEGRPVKLQWTREDDMEYGYFRPGGFHAYRGSLDNAGNLTAWQNHFITPSRDGESPMATGELTANVFPMDVTPNVKLTQTFFDSAIPTGPMRAPGSNALAFSFQSFMHELAVASGKRHDQFLLDVLGEPRQEGPMAMHTGRAADVIRRAAEISDFGREMPAGRALGLSFYYCHSGYVAMVADVSVDAASKEYSVHKVWAVADFGFIHNLAATENQMEGGIIDGLSQLAGQKITFENGRVEQLNFHQFPLLRIPRAPEMETQFLEPEGFSPTGSGEPSMPPILAAVTNAIFSATGERIRKMPLSDLGYRLV